MKHVKLFEAFINEALKKAKGKDISKNKKVFDEVYDKILMYLQMNADDIDWSGSELEEWLETDSEANPDFDYLDDIEDTAQAFLDWLES